MYITMSVELLVLFIHIVISFLYFHYILLVYLFIGWILLIYVYLFWIKSIWAYSGHYKPTAENLSNFMNFLEENGVDLKDVEVHS